MNLTVLGTSILLVLVVAEFLCRLILASPLPWRYPQVHYRSDTDLLFTLVPDQEAFTADKPIHINSAGLRGHEYPYERSGKTVRLLFLGDSIVFGYGVRNDETVGARVTTRLAENGISAEAINAGVPSYNTEQEVRYFQRDGLRYSPDWVIVGVCWNDINDKVGVRVSREGWLISEGVGDPGPMSRLSESSIGYTGRNLIKRSRLAFAIMEGMRALERLFFPEGHDLFRADVLEGHDTERIVRGWQALGRALQDLREVTEARRIRVLVVAFPIPAALEGDFPKSSYPEQLRRSAEAQRLTFLDLDPAFKSAYHGHDSLFIAYDGDHPNALGHDLAAQKIAEVLAESAREGPASMAKP